MTNPDMTPDEPARDPAPPDVADSAQVSPKDSVHEASASPSQPSPNFPGDAGQARAAESESGSQASESGETPEELAEETWLDEGGAPSEADDADEDPLEAADENPTDSSRQHASAQASDAEVLDHGETPEELAEETWLDEGGAEADPADADGSPTAAQASQVPQANTADPSETPDSSDPSDMSAFEADVEDSELSKALAQVDQLTDDLAHARADLFNLNQQYGNYVRRSKEAASGHRESGQQEVVEALLGVLDDIDAARAAGDLAEGPFASIATKLEDTLKTKFHVERFGQAGEDFDPTHHEALLSRDSADVDHPVVGQVLQPGYRMGEKVLRATKVMVHNPKPDQSAGE